MSRRNKPRVLILSTNSDEAGAPLHVETLARHLAEDIDFILLFGEDGPVLQRMRESGFDARLIPGMCSTISPIKDLLLLIRLIQVIGNAGPDLIHCHSSKAGMLGRLAGRFHRIPVLFTIHNWSWAALQGRAAVIALWLERQLARFRGVSYVYVCKEMETIGQNFLQLRPEQGAVVYNGVPDVGIAETAAPLPLTILMPARVSRLKDHKTLVCAFDTLPPNSSRLLLCGGGTETTEFSDALRTWAPRRHAEIEALGQRSDMPVHLHRSHILVLSSRLEAFPLSIIEAMSAGLPVIASDVGGVHELVTHGETGILVPPGDVEALATALSQLLDDKERKQMGDAGRRRYEASFTAKGMADRTRDFYYRLLTH